MEFISNIEPIYLLIIIGALKILDSLIQTYRSILVYKGRRILSTILVMIAQTLFLYVIAYVITSGDNTAKIIIILGTGVGSYLGMLIDYKFSKEVTYTNIITCNDRKHMKILGDYLRKEKIQLIMQDAYGRELQNTMVAIVFCKTREQSRIVDNFMKNHDKNFFREVL